MLDVNETGSRLVSWHFPLSSARQWAPLNRFGQARHQATAELSAAGETSIAPGEPLRARSSGKPNKLDSGWEAAHARGFSIAHTIPPSRAAVTLGASIMAHQQHAEFIYAARDLVHHQPLLALQLPVLAGELVQRQHRIVARVIGIAWSAGSAQCRRCAPSGSRRSRSTRCA